MQLRHAARTDAGKTRDHNEDSYGVEVGGERAAAGALFVVCDGIGGFASGEVASDLAVKTIIAHFYSSDNADARAALIAAFEASNQVVWEQGSGKMGTTGVAALFRDDAVTIANAGDCRAYLIRNGQPRQITRDHSFVAEQVAAGMLTEAQARESSYRNIITRAIGHRPEIEVDTFREPLLKDDIVVLCSDGLHGQVDASEIALAVSRVPLEDACARLIKLANDRGGPDNITIVAVLVAELTFKTQRNAQTNSSPTAEFAPAAVATQPVEHRTQKLQSAYGLSPASDRRRGDRRAPRAAVVQPQIQPNQAGKPLRWLLLYVATALLLAAVIFGAYYYLVIAGGGASELPVAAPPPTLTPTGGGTPTPLSATATLVPPAASAAP
ncbi:MAG: protein phosphatase 2C domain-containing protein [Chloroflexota bacterium]|nr:protein phosphatase 2C domain-containing protein [Chloroflexota bacterium]